MSVLDSAANTVLTDSGLCCSGIHEGRYNYSTVRTPTPDMQPTPYTVTGLRSFTQYTVTVQAFNSVGAGPTSQEVSATTHEAGSVSAIVYCFQRFSKN